MKHVSGKLLAKNARQQSGHEERNADAQNPLGQVPCGLQGSSAQEQRGREQRKET